MWNLRDTLNTSSSGAVLGTRTMPLALSRTDAAGSGCRAAASSTTTRGDCLYMRALGAVSGYHCTLTFNGTSEGAPSDTTRRTQNGTFAGVTGSVGLNCLFTMKANTPGCSTICGGMTSITAAVSLPAITTSTPPAAATAAAAASAAVVGTLPCDFIVSDAANSDSSPGNTSAGAPGGRSHA